MPNHGFTTYRPSGRAEAVLQAVRNICIQYEAWKSPLTVRQIFYRLVAKYNYPKREQDYSSLGGYIARSRRAFQAYAIDQMERGATAREALEATQKVPHLISFDWIRDDKGVSLDPWLTFDSEDHFIDDVDERVEDFLLNRQYGQDQVIELWCEAGGMVPLMREIGRPFSVRVSSGGGYDSVTSKYHLHNRVMRRYRESRTRTVVLHIGDFDPSGEGMYETLRDDVTQMNFDMGLSDHFCEFKRIALRADQVLEMEVETAPPKRTDSRRKAFVAKHRDLAEQMGTDDITAQLEALTPPDLRKLVGDSIESHFDMDTYQDRLEEEREARESLTKRMER